MKGFIEFYDTGRRTVVIAVDDISSIKSDSYSRGATITMRSGASYCTHDTVSEIQALVRKALEGR